MATGPRRTPPAPPARPGTIARPAARRGPHRTLRAWPAACPSPPGGTGRGVLARTPGHVGPLAVAVQQHDAPGRGSCTSCVPAELVFERQLDRLRRRWGRRRGTPPGRRPPDSRPRIGSNVHAHPAPAAHSEATGAVPPPPPGTPRRTRPPPPALGSARATPAPATSPRPARAWPTSSAAQGDVPRPPRQHERRQPQPAEHRHRRGSTRMHTLRARASVPPDGRHQQPGRRRQHTRRRPPAARTRSPTRSTLTPNTKYAEANVTSTCSSATPPWRRPCPASTAQSGTGAARSRCQRLRCRSRSSSRPLSMPQNSRYCRVMPQKLCDVGCRTAGRSPRAPPSAPGRTAVPRRPRMPPSPPASTTASVNTPSAHWLSRALSGCAKV